MPFLRVNWHINKGREEEVKPNVYIVYLEIIEGMNLNWTIFLIKELGNTFRYSLDIVAIELKHFLDILKVLHPSQILLAIFVNLLNPSCFFTLLTKKCKSREVVF